MFVQTNGRFSEQSVNQVLAPIFLLFLILRQPGVQGCAAAFHLFGNGGLGNTRPEACADGFRLAVQHIYLACTSFRPSQL